MALRRRRQRRDRTDHPCAVKGVGKEERHTASLTASQADGARARRHHHELLEGEVHRRVQGHLSGAAQMKRAVCPNPEINACASSSCYRTTSRCARTSAARHACCRRCSAWCATRGTGYSSKSDAYYRLMGRLGGACGDMPMRYAMRVMGERQDVLELCEEVWDEHEGMFAKLTTLPGDDEFARNLCADELGQRKRMSVAQLFASTCPIPRKSSMLFEASARHIAWRTGARSTCGSGDGTLRRDKRHVHRDTRHVRLGISRRRRWPTRIPLWAPTGPAISGRIGRKRVFPSEELRMYSDLRGICVESIEQPREQQGGGAGPGFDVLRSLDELASSSGAAHGRRAWRAAAFLLCVGAVCVCL